VKRRHLPLEDVRRDCDDAACEPWAEEGTGIAAVKQPSPGTPWFFVRRSGGHPDNSIAPSAFANIPDVVTAVAPIVAKVDLVSVKIA
jgi:hypothetical protein